LLIAALLALRNLRSGRSDRRGAFRLALFFFLMRMAVWAFTAHHVADTRELFLLFTGLQSALFWSCFVGVMYLALEPYLRRRWPDRIISWNRLLAGDFRDPMIGRDILIGTAIGFFCVMLMHLRVALQSQFTGPGIPDLMDGWDLGVAGVNAFAQMFINQLSAGITQAFILVFMLLFLSLLLRREWAGIVISVLILWIVIMAPAIANEPWIGTLVATAVVVAFVLCAARFGPLALMATFTVFHVWVFYLVTPNLTAWYATGFILVSITLLSIAIYSFYISLGGQKIFSGKLFEEGLDR
jgi:serine/threonine-protein kinase